MNKHQSNNRINWNDVAKDLPGRTKNQCQTYSRLALQQQKDTNFKWKVEDISHLIFLVNFYGSKWKFLKQHYFQHLQIDQIRSAFVYYNHYMYQQLEILDKIKNKQLAKQDLDNKQLQNLKQLLPKLQELREHQRIVETVFSQIQSVIESNGQERGLVETKVVDPLDVKSNLYFKEIVDYDVAIHTIEEVLK